jgi:hypothetical protein
MTPTTPSSHRALLAAAVTLSVIVALVFAAATVRAEKPFPPPPGADYEEESDETTETIERADNTEDSLIRAVHAKMRAAGEAVPGDDEHPDGGGAGAAAVDPEQARRRARFSGTPMPQEDPAAGKGDSQGADKSTQVRPKERTACERDEKSIECAKERKAMADSEQVQQERMNKTAGDATAYSRISERFNFLINEWACAATGAPLFSVSGDHDIVNYVARMLSHAFLEQGQHYGSNIVLEYHAGQDTLRQEGKWTPPDCLNVRLGDGKLFASVITALLLHRDLVHKWLEDSEVDSSPIIASYVPEMRNMIKKWTLGRLLFGFGKCMENVTSAADMDVAANSCPVRNNEMLLALLPLQRDENAPLDECQAAGQLHAIIDTKREGAVQREVARMLDGCLEHGKIAEDPIEFGETLRRCGRTKQARQLFEVAVQRGKLCNPWQRPEEFMRKDLTAAPVWTTDSFPSAKLHTRELRSIVRRLEESLNWTEMSVLHPSMRTGYWQRAWLFGNHEFNPKFAAIMNASDVARVKAIVAEIRATNDAYDWSCNGSIVVEMWRLSGAAAQSDVILGSTNMVLHMLVPVRGTKRIVFQLGEDTAQLDATPAGEDDALVYDDTFEHRFMFEGVPPIDGTTFVASTAVTTPPVMTEARVHDAVVLHVQLCHPDMHEKALDPPGKYCADAEWE